VPDPVHAAEASGHADAHAHAAGHAAHPPFDIKEAILHHNLPYPAWEPIHGSPVITFDLGTYAAMNLASIRDHHAAEFAAADAAPHRAWAEQVVAAKDFRYDAGLKADDVAKAMTVAQAQSSVVFPQALSWLNQQLFFGGVALTALFVLIAVIFRRKSNQLRPAGRVQHALEAIVVYIRDQIVEPSFHHGARAWTPFFVAMFLMILVVNLMGLLPGTGTMSGNIGVTGGFAVIIFLAMLVFGMKEQGPKYWITLVPIPFKGGMALIWPLLFAIEMLGLVIRPFALAVRLFANMFAGHTVLLVFLSLAYVVMAQSQGQATGLASGLGLFGFAMAVAFHAMELLVAFVQAYIFTMLSAMFIGMSIHPEH